MNTMRLRPNGLLAQPPLRKMSGRRASCVSSSRTRCVLDIEGGGLVGLDHGTAMLEYGVLTCSCWCCPLAVSGGTSEHVSWMQNGRDGRRNRHTSICV
jgi:hypothetical protein